MSMYRYRGIRKYFVLIDNSWKGVVDKVLGKEDGNLRIGELRGKMEEDVEGCLWVVLRSLIYIVRNVDYGSFLYIVVYVNVCVLKR